MWLITIPLYLLCCQQRLSSVREWDNETGISWECRTVAGLIKYFARILLRSVTADYCRDPIKRIVGVLLRLTICSQIPCQSLPMRDTFPAFHGVPSRTPLKVAFSHNKTQHSYTTIVAVYPLSHSWIVVRCVYDNRLNLTHSSSETTPDQMASRVILPGVSPEFLQS